MISQINGVLVFALVAVVLIAGVLYQRGARFEELAETRQQKIAELTTAVEQFEADQASAKAVTNKRDEVVAKVDQRAREVIRYVYRKDPADCDRAQLDPEFIRLFNDLGAESDSGVASPGPPGAEVR